MKNSFAFRRRHGQAPAAAVLISLVILFVAGLVNGCGYQLAGQGQYPGDASTIAVRMLENRSSETGFETLMTSALVNELNRRRQGSVVSAGSADAVLTGTIQSLTWDTVSYRGSNTASERRVYATVSLTLTDIAGNVVWKKSGLRAEQAYAVVSDNKTATDYNRRQAIAELAERMAETVYRSLTDNF